MTNQFHVIYTSAHGPLLISFETNDQRDAWCELQDDTFESFFAVDGVVSNVFSTVICPEKE